MKIDNKYIVKYMNNDKKNMSNIYCVYVVRYNGDVRFMEIGECIFR